MADIYLDSDEEVLRINGKCYLKVTGDTGYQTHSKAVIRDSFTTGCNDCYTTVTINPGEVCLLTRTTENVRFTGIPGESALIVLDDGNNIFNIEIANISGNFVFDNHNVNGVEKIFGTPPESHTFTLGGLTHTFSLTRLGSFICDFLFNTTNVPFVDQFPNDSNRNGTVDSSDGDPYSTNTALKAGFSVDSINPNFANSVTNYIEVDICCHYGHYKSSTPHGGSREDALSDIASQINLVTESTGLRCSWDGSDFRVWFTANPTIKPSLEVVVSVATVETGFEVALDDNYILDFRDSDNDGTYDKDDCDPLGLLAGVPLIYDKKSTSFKNFPESESDEIIVGIGGSGRRPPDRYYRSTQPPTDIGTALADVARHIQQDFELGLVDYGAQIGDDGSLNIINPTTGNAPNAISAEINTNGFKHTLTPGAIVQPVTQPAAITISGITDHAGAPNGHYAPNGVISSSGWKSYSNNAGWEVFHDTAQFVITDTPGAKSGNWLGNLTLADITADYTTGLGFTTGQVGVCVPTAFQSTHLGFGTHTFNQVTSIAVNPNYTLDTKKFPQTPLKINLDPGEVAYVNYWFFDNPQPCIKKEGSYKLVTIANEGGSLVFDSTNTYDTRHVFGTPPETLATNIIPVADRKYASHGAVVFEFQSF